MTHKRMAFKRFGKTMHCTINLEATWQAPERNAKSCELRIAILYRLDRASKRISSIPLEWEIPRITIFCIIIIYRKFSIFRNSGNRVDIRFTEVFDLARVYSIIEGKNK